MARDDSALRTAVLALDITKVHAILREPTPIDEADQDLLLALATVKLESRIVDPTSTFSSSQLDRLNAHLSMNAIVTNNLNAVRAAIQAADCFTATQATTLSSWIMQLGKLLHTQSEIAIALIKAGINTNQRDPVGRTALHLAAERQLTPLIEAMLNQGMPVDSRDAAGNTPLLSLVKITPPELVRRAALDSANRLVAAGADISASDIDDIRVSQYCEHMPRLYASIHAPNLNYTLVARILTSHRSPERSECPEPVSAPLRKGGHPG